MDTQQRVTGALTLKGIAEKTEMGSGKAGAHAAPRENVFTYV